MIGNIGYKKNIDRCLQIQNRAGFNPRSGAKTVAAKTIGGGGQKSGKLVETLLRLLNPMFVKEFAMGGILVPGVA